FLVIRRTRQNPGVCRNSDSPSAIVPRDTHCRKFRGCPQRYRGPISSSRTLGISDQRGNSRWHFLQIILASCWSNSPASPLHFSGFHTRPHLVIGFFFIEISVLTGSASHRLPRGNMGRRGSSRSRVCSSCRRRTLAFNRSWREINPRSF